MPSAVPKPFQVLALSGGGFRGLYTAKVIADVERDIGAPIASRFDLITGTSIGGILALALALEIPAQNIVDLFVGHGEEIFKKRWSLLGMVRAPYSPAPLSGLLSDSKLFGDRLLGACKHPVIIPSLNYSTGEPVVFKTPHHIDFKRDHAHRIVDVALATSAAPAYFPRHAFNNSQYVDGGLYANAPGALGLHEAHKFFNQDIDNVRLLAVGTMSSRFTVDPRRNRDGGVRDWGGWSPIKMSRRLFGLSISAQEVLTDLMLGQGSVTEPRLHLQVTNGTEDLVSSKLPALQAYQLSLKAPAPPAGSFDVAAAARGKLVFEGAGSCAGCHSGPLFTDANTRLHPPTDSMAELESPSYASRSATKQYRTPPLKGLWQHSPYFHDGSAATLMDVVRAYNGKRALGLSDQQVIDLTEYLKSL